jgi:drug/metabolite transporter (DMT)-like permease
MPKTDIAALLALSAALFIAVGNVIHQRAARQVTDKPVGHVGLFARLLRYPRWWAGSLAGAVGFGLQAAALGLGSVLLVQALLVTALLFALPINARVTRRRMTSREWTWAVLLAVAVAIVVTIGHPSAGHARASMTTWAVAIVAIGPALVFCLVAARKCVGPRVAVLLAMASALSWALFAVLTKGVIGVLGDGVGALLRAPELYGWLLAALGATVWQQSSFRAGALTASLPTLTVCQPVLGSVLGITMLGEVLRPGRAGWSTLAVAVLVMIAATVALARDEAATVAAGRGGGAAATRQPAMSPGR